MKPTNYKLQKTFKKGKNNIAASNSSCHSEFYRPFIDEKIEKPLCCGRPQSSSDGVRAAPQMSLIISIFKHPFSFFVVRFSQKRRIKVHFGNILSGNSYLRFHQEKPLCCNFSLHFESASGLLYILQKSTIITLLTSTFQQNQHFTRILSFQHVFEKKITFIPLLQFTALSLTDQRVRRNFLVFNFDSI